MGRWDEWSKTGQRNKKILLGRNVGYDEIVLSRWARRNPTDKDITIFPALCNHAILLISLAFNYWARRRFSILFCLDRNRVSRNYRLPISNPDIFSSSILMQVTLSESRFLFVSLTWAYMFLENFFLYI